MLLWLYPMVGQQTARPTICGGNAKREEWGERRKLDGDNEKGRATRATNSGTGLKRGKFVRENAGNKGGGVRSRAWCLREGPLSFSSMPVCCLNTIWNYSQTLASSPTLFCNIT